MIFMSGQGCAAFPAPPGWITDTIQIPWWRCQMPVYLGQNYSRLTVTGSAGKDRHGHAMWHCSCNCGGKTTVCSSNLLGGKVRSCGCLKVEAAIKTGHANTRHGESEKTAEWKVWQSMFSRCNDPRNPSFEHYGARGILVCDRWGTYECFLADVGRRPSDLHSIDRIDVNKGYQPGNVRWATITEQARNRRDNRFIECDGLRMTLVEWAEKTGIGRATIAYRIDHGWSIEKALTAKPKGFQ